MSRRIRTPSLAALAAVFAAACLASPARAGHKPPRPHAVGWNDICGWRPMGKRWLAALDCSGTAIAIYDLSYPDFYGRTRLASTSQKHVDNKALEAEGSDPLRLPPGWWKRVHWRDPRVAESAQPPARFGFDDLAGAAGTAVLQEKSVERPEDPDGAETPRSILQQIELVRRVDGGYDIFWTGKPGAAGTAGLKHGSKPKKIADLRVPSAGMVKALSWELLDDTINLVFSIDAVPVLENLIAVGVRQYFNFRVETRNLHLEMAIEMLNAADDGDCEHSAFCSLSAPERARAEQSVLLMESDLANVGQWLFRSPTQAWQRSMEKYRKRSARALGWLDKHHETVEQLLNPRYAVAVDGKGQRRIYALPRFRLFQRSRPHVAVDYAHPLRNRDERVAAEAAEATLDFADRFIPYVSTVITGTYDFIVTNRLQSSKEWDARLMAHLEERELHGESWDNEIHILNSGFADPFMISLDETNQLIRLRQRDLGLPETPELTQAYSTP